MYMKVNTSSGSYCCSTYPWNFNSDSIENGCPGFCSEHHGTDDVDYRYGTLTWDIFYWKNQEEPNHVGNQKGMIGCHCGVRNGHGITTSFYYACQGTKNNPTHKDEIYVLKHDETIPYQTIYGEND